MFEVYKMKLILIVMLAVSYCSCEPPQDYTVNEKDGHAYKLMYKAQPWAVAKETCAQEGAKLAVPKSKEEFLFIQGIVRRMHYPYIEGTKYRYLVWLGVNNIEDYRIWKNVDGENILETGFHDWSGNNGQSISSDPKEPHCAGVDAVNPGFRDFWCHLAQPYLCEKMVINEEQFQTL